MLFTDFTPVAGLLGGAMIGASAGALLLLNGDIMGLSGIFSSNLVHPLTTSQQHPWKIIFASCFLTTSTLYVNWIDENAIESNIVPTTLAHVIGGLFVGYGTKLGNGCTSGHGICGLARKSLRSAAAVVAFMTTAIVTTVLVASSPLFRSEDKAVVYPLLGIIVSALSIVASLYYIFHEHYKKYLGASLAAVLASCGLGLSGMVRYMKVENFLNVRLLWTYRVSQYDPTLMTVMGGGVVCSWIAYQFLDDHRPSILPRRYSLGAPILSNNEFNVPDSTVVDWKLIGGASMFGIGWGLSLLCPGPAFFVVASGNVSALVAWLPMYVVGAYLAEQTMKSQLWNDRWVCHAGPSKQPLQQPSNNTNNTNVVESDTDDASDEELSPSDMAAIRATVERATAV